MDHPNPAHSQSEMARLAMEQQRLAQNDVEMPEDSYGDDYDLEVEGDPNFAAHYENSKDAQMMEMHIQAMCEQVLKVTEQVGDPNLAMTMMRLDDFEKQIVLKKLREQLYLQQQQQMMSQMESADLDPEPFIAESQHKPLPKKSGSQQPGGQQQLEKPFEADLIGQQAVEVQPQIAQPPISWIEWYCLLEDNQFLTQVERGFIKDPANYADLVNAKHLNFPKLPRTRFEDCLRLILSLQSPTKDDLENQIFLQLQQDASELYALIHARFIRSPEGLAKVYRAYLKMGYGFCMRALCDRQPVIPVGLSDKLHSGRVKVFCPRCEEVYIPMQKFNLDGAHFGPSLPHMFFTFYRQAITFPPKMHLYEPRIFGFKIAGKRGSKYFNPSKSSEQTTAERLETLRNSKPLDSAQQLQHDNNTTSKKRHKKRKQ